MIYRMTKYDLMQTKAVPGNYYMCTDSRQLFYDKSDRIRQEIQVTFIAKENDRLTSIRPSDGTYYYVWDTNSLWYYDAGWVLKDGQGNRSSAYYYVNNVINPTDDVIVIDNNGLLGDGSVVVRDFNRIIKGQLYIKEENNTNELIISSFLNAGIKLLPNGTLDSAGTLSLCMNKETRQGRLEFYGDIYSTKDDGINFYRLGKLVDVPNSSSSAGTKGDYAVDNTFLYVCVFDNYWKRIPLQSW